MTLLRPLSPCAALALLAGTAAAQANDECTGALPVTVGTTFFDTSGSTTSIPAFDCETNYNADIWYVFTAPQSSFYEFSICSANYDSIIEVSDGTCAALNVLGCRDDACGLQSATTVMCMAGQDYYVRIGGWGSSQGSGDLEITPIMARDLTLAAHYKLDDTSVTAVDSSGNGQDGFYQNVNQGVAGAAPGTNTAAEFDGMTSYVEIFAGGAPLSTLQSDLSLSLWINLDNLPPDLVAGTEVYRFFSNDGPGGSWSLGITEFGQLRFTTHGVLDYDQPVTVVPGQWHHIVAVMDILNDVTFYFDGVAVGTIAGANASNTPEDIWFIGAWDPGFAIPEFLDGTIDDVQVYGGAMTASDVMDLFSNPGSTVGMGGPLGTNYCTAATNSTGGAASIDATGSNVAADNDLTLMASGLPPQQFGIFLTSMTQASTPVASGTLCVGGSIIRFQGPGQILQANGAGEYSLAIDISALPAGVPTPIVAGDTYNFTTWFRDIDPAIGNTANFSNGYSITFQ